LSPVALAPPPLVPVEGAETPFPVGRIFCVGRNYAAHAREMGANPDREPPFFFAKFADAVVVGGGEVPYPSQTADYHYEGELVVALGAGGANVSTSAALDLVFGYAAGLDMTRRDLQSRAKDKGHPWFTGKTFSHSAPLSPIRPVSAGHVERGAIQLRVNGELRQDADIADMTWSVAEVIAYLSRYEPLKPGDLIFTGTPSGVGPVQPGDRIDLRIEGLTPLSVAIGPPA
jgi:fumarylpyruvate hydrolase